jgi:hypothetical protein
MDVKTLQQAANAAIALDIENAKTELGMSLNEHAEAFTKLAPTISKFLVALGKLNVDKLEAEMN